MFNNIKETKLRYNYTILQLWWLLPLFLQPRSIRIMYARYWYDWMKHNFKEYDIERRQKYVKGLVDRIDFLNIKPRRN